MALELISVETHAIFLDMNYMPQNYMKNPLFPIGQVSVYEI